MIRRFGNILLATLLLIPAITGCNVSVTPNGQSTLTDTSITATPSNSPVNTDVAVADVANTPAPDESRIIPSVYQDYYMSGWLLEFGEGLIYTDAPSGTGSEMVNAYIRSTDGEERPLTPYMGAFEKAYLSGEWLYFTYADTDKSVYNTCRINVINPGEPEFMDVFNLFATDDFFYYRKGKDYLSVDQSNVYRCDANFANERLVFSDVASRWSLAPAGDKVIAFADNFDDGQSNMFVVHDQDGKALYDVQVDSRMSYDFPFHIYDGVLYWCDRANAPDAPVRAHMLNLQSGDVTDIPELFLDVEGTIYGIVDVDDTWIYVEVSLPHPADWDDEALFQNTHLYKMLRSGGELEFVRSWFES